LIYKNILFVVASPATNQRPIQSFGSRPGFRFF
jgi:hypothetical protein